MSEENSRIGDLKRRLYSREGGSAHRKRQELHEREYGIQEKWKKAKRLQPKRDTRAKKGSFLKYFLLISVLFFIGSLGLSSYLFYGEKNVVSSENVEIQIQGPTSIGGGEELTLQIEATNKNNVPITLADIIIEYPEGTRAAINISRELPRVRETLGTIKPEESIQKTAKSVLFGEENSEKEIKITIEYRIEGSNAIFFRDQIYKLKISSSPISLSVKALKEVISGQEIEFVITAVSNSVKVMEDILLKAEYPFGFDFVSSAPDPAFNTSVWELGDIPPGERRVVRIRGVMEGQNNEERVFRFSSGIQSDTDEKELATAFISDEETVLIKRPFVNTIVSLDGDTSPEHVAVGGAKVRADITWENSLPTQVINGEIEVRLNGSVLNKNSISVERGFYSSIDNKILWNKGTGAPLGFISPGEQGRVSFSFASHNLSSGLSFRNPEIDIEVSVRGTRISDNDVPEAVNSSVNRTVKISSDLRLTSRALYFSGPFINSGPVPPRVDKETTYTITWTAQNSSNEMSDTTVVATMPSYLRWMGVVVPQHENVTFNPIGGRITWDLGDVEPTSNGLGGRREVSFQVAMTPSITQIGNDPVLVNEQRIEGYDTFADVQVVSSHPALDTRLNTDPGFVDGQSTVTN